MKKTFYFVLACGGLFGCATLQQAIPIGYETQQSGTKQPFGFSTLSQPLGGVRIIEFQGNERNSQQAMIGYMWRKANDICGKTPKRADLSFGEWSVAKDIAGKPLTSASLLPSSGQVANYPKTILTLECD